MTDFLMEMMQMLQPQAGGQDQRLAGMGLDPNQAALLQQQGGALGGTQQPEMTSQQMGGGGLSQDQLVAAMLMQSMMQQNQQYQSSPDQGTRLFGLAQSGALPMANALARMPLIKQQMQAQKQAQMFETLKALSGLQKTQAETQEIGKKSDRAERKLNLESSKSEIDAKFKEAGLMLQKLGLDDKMIRTGMDQVRLEIDQKKLEMEGQKFLVELQKLEREDPELANLISAAKLTKGPQGTADPDLMRTITERLEQKLGVRLKDNRNFMERILPEFLGGKQDPRGMPLGQQAPVTSVSQPQVPETISEEDQLIRELMGQ